MLKSDLQGVAGDPVNARRVVIIGGGTIGLYVAVLLAGQGRDVLVLEAGDEHLGSFDAKTYASVGREHRGLELARSRCLGGTSNLWGGQLVEYQAVDFNGREYLAHSRWPVSHDEIAPYYAQTYRNLGVPDRFLNDSDVWSGLSAACPSLGADFEVFLTRWMRQPNVAVLFKEQVETNKNLNVVTGQTVVGFRALGGRITGVRAVDKKGESHWIGGDVFILAAGTVENARLLLHTAADPGWGCPWRDNANVGRYFQDHLGRSLGPFKPRDKKAFFNMFCNMVYSGQKFQPKIRMKCDSQLRERMLNVQASIMFESKASEHLVFLKQFLRAAIGGRKFGGIGDLFRNGAGCVKYLFPLMWRYTVDHRIFVPSSANIQIGVQAEQVPLADSRISIDPGVRDVYGLPKVIVDWRIGNLELETVRKFAVMLRDSLEKAQIGQLNIDQGLLNLDPSYLRQMHDTYHQAGGAIMGFSDQDGVVDRDLRVFGTDNLYVGGASIFRTSSNANVTFTAMMFATRLAERLLRESPTV
jgi:choline dehydrogenase-like flavoprotein